HDQIEAMTLADRVVVMNQGLVQQVGTPTDIYDAPANTFVAGFIGSPAMNLLEGALDSGTFTGDRVEITDLTKKHSGPVILGFRAEDASVSSEKAQINATVYSMELLGEATMVTMQAGGGLVAVKADKDYRANIDDHRSISVPASICHLFDKASGERIAV
ncbi:MAG: ABC transporter ATP-binding protein, partial [Rhizobiaceae bacterium]